MKKLVIGLFAGLILGISGTALATQTETVQAVFAQFNLKINGQDKQFETPPLVYDGTSYLPVREIANLVGYDVTYVDESRTIVLNKTEITPQGDDSMQTRNTLESKIKYIEGEMNKEFVVGNVTIKLNSIDYTDFVPYKQGDAAGFVPREGEQFAVINFDVFTIEEPSNRFEWSANDFISHIVVNEKNLSGSQSTGDSSRINPGERKTVSVFYSIPENLTVSSVSFRDPKDFLIHGIVNVQ